MTIFWDENHSSLISSRISHLSSESPRSGSAAFRSRSGSTPRSIRRKRCNWRRPANSWQSRRTSLEFPIAGSILHGLQPDGRVSADFGHLPMLFAMGSAFSPWVSLINNQWQIDMNRELNDTEILNMPVINHHWQPLVHHWMIHGTWRPAPRYPLCQQDAHHSLPPRFLPTLLSSRLGVGKSAFACYSRSIRNHTNTRGSGYLPLMPKKWSVECMYIYIYDVHIICASLVCTVSEQVSSQPQLQTHPTCPPLLLQVLFLLSELVLGVFRWSVEITQLHPTWISPHLHQAGLHILTFTILPASIPGAVQPKSTLMWWFSETSSRKKTKMKNQKEKMLYTPRRYSFAKSITRSLRSVQASLPVLFKACASKLCMPFHSEVLRARSFIWRCFLASSGFIRDQTWLPRKCCQSYITSISPSISAVCVSRSSIFLPCCSSSALPPNHGESHDGRAASTRATPRALLPTWWEQARGPYPQLQWLQHGIPPSKIKAENCQTKRKHEKDRLDRSLGAHWFSSQTGCHVSSTAKTKPVTFSSSFKT